MRVASFTSTQQQSDLRQTLHFDRQSESFFLSHQYTITHLAHPLANSMTTFITNSKRKGDSTDPWSIPTSTSNSSSNSESSYTLVFVPSYRLIADLTKISGIPFFLIANSNTSLVLCQKLSIGLQYMYTTFSINIILFLHPS